MTGMMIALAAVVAIPSPIASAAENDCDFFYIGGAENTLGGTSCARVSFGGSQSCSTVSHTCTMLLQIRGEHSSAGDEVRGRLTVSDSEAIPPCEDTGLVGASCSTGPIAISVPWNECRSARAETSGWLGTALLTNSEATGERCNTWPS